MKISNRFQKLPAPENRVFWFCVLLIIKFSLLYFLISEDRPTLLPNTIAVCSGDCDSYLAPVDRLLSHGSYEPDFRMPGYGFPYFVFHLFVKKDIAVNLLILFQTILDALASMFLALMLYWLTGKRIAFLLTLVLYGISVTVSSYNNWVLTESLTCSVLIMGLYYLVRHTREKRDYHIILSGLFFTWSYFLRPVNFPILIITAIFFFFFLVKDRKMRYTLLFLLPALVFNSAWSIRNYFTKGKAYLLTENVYIKSWYGEDGLAGLEFCKTFSDFKITYNYFETRGLSYFGQAIQRYTLDDIKIPHKIFTPDFNNDSLLLLRQLFLEKNLPQTTTERLVEIESILKYKFELYTESIKRHHPFLVYVKTPLLLTKSFILQAGVHNLYFMPFTHQPFHKKLIKLFFISIYVISFGIFIAGLLFYKKIFDNKLIFLSYVIAFYIIFIHSIFLRSIEPRYIIPAYPFFVIAAVFTLNSVINSFNKQRVND